MWLILAMLTAISEAGKDIFHSQRSIRPLSPVLKAWAITVTSIPVLAVVLHATGVPRIAPSFWAIAATNVVLLSGAKVLYMRTLSLGPLSQTQPILALTTVLLTITNPLLTNDHVSSAGWTGVVMVGFGIYATQHPGRDPTTGKIAGFASPFVEMMKQPGVLSKLGVAVIFSVTSNLDKLAVERSSGPFYLLVEQVLIALILGSVLLILRAKDVPLVNEPEKDDATGTPIRVASTRYLLIGGSINACTLLMHMWALTLVPVPFVIAVKRLSIILTSLWGYLVRKERAPHWYRLVGVALVVGGIAVMVLLGKALKRLAFLFGA